MKNLLLTLALGFSLTTFAALPTVKEWEQALGDYTGITSQENFDKLRKVESELFRLFTVRSLLAGGIEVAQVRCGLTKDGRWLYNPGILLKKPTVEKVAPAAEVKAVETLIKELKKSGPSVEREIKDKKAIVSVYAVYDEKNVQFSYASIKNGQLTQLEGEAAENLRALVNAWMIEAQEK